MERRQPVNVPVLLNKLRKTAKTFIDQYDENRSRLTGVVQELKKTADRMKELRDDSDTKNLIIKGIGALGVGLGAAAVGAILLGDAEKAQKLAFGVPAILALNAVTYQGFRGAADANSAMLEKQREMLELVDTPCEELKCLIELQKDVLMEIRNVLGEINEKSVVLKTTAGPQANKTLSEIDGFMNVLQGMREEAERNRAKLFYTQLVGQSEKICEELSKMRNVLRELEQ